MPGDRKSTAVSDNPIRPHRQALSGAIPAFNRRDRSFFGKRMTSSGSNATVMIVRAATSSNKVENEKLQSAARCCKIVERH
jgi:hypothetical protein